MVINIDKLPPRHIFFYAIYTFIPLLCAFLLYSVFLSGAAHGIPDDFAVDNEQRVYLSYNTGVFVAVDCKFTNLLPPIRGGYTLSVTDDDLLTIADGTDVRIIDLSKSDLAAGRLERIELYSVPGNAPYTYGRERWQLDSQNDATYRFEGNPLYYEIYREDSCGISVFFAMPHSDYVWNLVAKSCFILFFFYIGAGLLFIKLYSKKHPEILGKRAVNPFSNTRKLSH